MRTKLYIKRFFRILLILIILAIIVIVSYLFIKKPKIINTIIGNKKEESITDVYNGIYSYEEQLPQSYKIFSGCNIYALYNYIVIINDEFKYYDSSCMSTNFIKSGKVSDLKINYDKKTKHYKINYENKEFTKDEKVMQIVESKDLTNKFTSATFDTIKFVIDKTEVSGSYYSFDVKINGINKKYTFNFIYNKDANNFTIEIINDSETVIYTKTLTDLTNLPEFYAINDNIAIIEKNKINAQYKYNLMLLSEEGEIYNLTKQLPIKINYTNLSYDNNQVFIKYNNDNSFNVLFGYNNNFCNENQKEGISYYEFEIKYDYSKKNLAIPDYKKTGYNKDGCNYINKNYFKE